MRCSVLAGLWLQGALDEGGLMLGMDMCREHPVLGGF